MRATIATAALLFVFSSGCATTKASSKKERAEAAGEADASRGGGASEDEGAGNSLEIPKGFREAEILDLVATGRGGGAVLLTEATGPETDAETVVPIFVGDSQLRVIELRHERRRYSRPLTHDLLDEILEELGGTISKVHIDALKDGIYVATVFIRAEGSAFEFDARSSDAIALALGSQAPILIADGVLEKAGVPREKFEGRRFRQKRRRPPIPPKREPKEKEEQPEGESSEEEPYL